MIALLEARRAGLLSRAHLPTSSPALAVGIVADAPLRHGLRHTPPSLSPGSPRPCSGAQDGVDLRITGGFIAAVAGILTAQYWIAGRRPPPSWRASSCWCWACHSARLSASCPSPSALPPGSRAHDPVGQWKDFFGLLACISTRSFLLPQALSHPHPGHQLIASGTLSRTVSAASKRLPRARRQRPLWCRRSAVRRCRHHRQVPSAACPRELPGCPGLHCLATCNWSGRPSRDRLGAIESLLTAVAADARTARGTIPTRNSRPGRRQHHHAAVRRLRSHRCHRAYRHQINGATSPVAGVVHALVLLLVILILAPWRHTPLAALAAILFFVA